MYNFDIHLTPKKAPPIEKVYIEKKIPDEKIVLNDLKNNGVITKIIKVLENIPTDFTQSQMLYIVNVHNQLYQNSKNIKKYIEELLKYDNDALMKTKYSILIKNLFIKFDEEYKKITKSLKKVSFENF